MPKNEWSIDISNLVTCTAMMAVLHAGEIRPNIGDRHAYAPRAEHACPVGSSDLAVPVIPAHTSTPSTPSAAPASSTLTAAAEPTYSTIFNPSKGFRLRDQAGIIAEDLNR
jgi:hypothetical protein